MTSNGLSKLPEFIVSRKSPAAQEFTQAAQVNPIRTSTVEDSAIEASALAAPDEVAE
jgi:trehalose-6-phosphate synthase